MNAYIHTYILTYIDTYMCVICVIMFFYTGTYAHAWLCTYIYTTMHIYTIYTCHSSNNFVSAVQKANRLSSSNLLHITMLNKDPFPIPRLLLTTKAREIIVSEAPTLYACSDTINLECLEAAFIFGMLIHFHYS